MKKTILAVLMAVMVATPCFAQEIETDGLFSLSGTNWTALPISMMIFPIPLLPWPIDIGASWGFYGGEVYPISFRAATNSFYVDMLVASIFMYVREAAGIVVGPYIEIGFGIMQPIGIGLMTTYYKEERNPVPIIVTVLLIKTDDNWTPPEDE
jgi:hypothetical protein